MTCAVGPIGYGGENQGADSPLSSLTRMGNACAANPQGNIYDDDDEVEEVSASNRANSLNADLARLKRSQNEVLRGNDLFALLT